MSKLTNSFISFNNIPEFHSLEELRCAMGTNRKYFYKCLYANQFLYKSVKIPKKNKSEFRELLIPNMALKNMQRWILDNILYNCETHICATGFVPQKSIVDNALPHIRKKYILKMDISDFFPSINFKKARSIFHSMGYNHDVATALANICTINNQLPQGAPTSPYIANLYCVKLDERLFQLCKKNNLDYTRYADDITISGDRNILWIKDVVSEILFEFDFKNNDKKSVILKPGDRKKVTGIIVNERISVPKSIIREIRMTLYFINKYGLEKHLSNINYDINMKNYYINHLFGKISFVKMIDLKKGLDFQHDFYSLFKKEKTLVSKNYEVLNIEIINDLI